MAKKRIFDLPQTKGEFKARGFVTGTAKDKFFQIKKTKTGKQQFKLRFGVKVLADGSSVYQDMQYTEQDNVYFYKKGDKKNNIKGESKAVPLANRSLFKEEGFEPIGMKVGIEQYIDEKGSLKNNNSTMFDVDGIQYLADNLKEDLGVFVRGNLEFSSYVNGTTGDKVRMTKFVPNQISGVTSDINLEDEKYVPVNDFRQTIIFMSAELDETDKEDKKGIISAKIVTYNSIEDAEFIVRDKKLFATMKKNLKPYNAIQVFGKINNKIEIEEVVDDGWGSQNNSFENKGNSFIRELLILGADPSTIDKDTYTQSNIEEAIKAIKENQKAKESYGETSNSSNEGDWGSDLPNSEENDLEDWG